MSCKNSYQCTKSNLFSIRLKVTKQRYGKTEFKLKKIVREKVKKVFSVSIMNLRNI